MNGEVSAIMKYGLIVFGILQIAYGIWWFVAPELWNAVTGWPDELAAGRALGAMITTFGVASVLAFRAKSWQRIEIVVQALLLMCFLGAVAQVWSYVIRPTLPPAAWINVAILIVFLLWLGYGYFTRRQVKG